MTAGPSIEPYGDHGLLARLDSTASVLGLAAALDPTRLEGVIDVVPAARTVLVTFDPDLVPAARVHDWVSAGVAARPDAAVAAGPASRGGGPVVEIPVVYDGDDLGEVASLAGLSGPAEVVRRHTAAEYVVTFNGFAPGFGYLSGGDPLLRVPRRSTPREQVPAGAVGLAGEYSGVYPRPSPGGWQLLGRTGAALWDTNRDPPALLVPGTRVRFVAVDEQPDPAPTHAGTRSSSSLLGGTPAAEVAAAGGLTTVQDLGRPGLAHLGVTRSGAADRAALRLGNRLVGNDEDAAGLEVTLGGLTLRFLRAVTVAVTGASGLVTAGGRLIAANAPVSVRGGDILTFGIPDLGVRSYLAVRGGVAADLVLGSRSTDLLAGLGPAPLRAGDQVSTGDAARIAPSVDVAPVPARTAEPVLSIRPGPGLARLTAAARTAVCQALCQPGWRVAAASNRIAVRLEGPGLDRPGLEGPGLGLVGDDDPMPSEGLVRGAIQVPPDGRPIVFLADHPVTGGYPVVGVVADAHLDRCAQLRSGDVVRFAIRAIPPG